MKVGSRKNPDFRPVGIFSTTFYEELEYKNIGIITTGRKTNEGVGEHGHITEGSILRSVPFIRYVMNIIHAVYGKMGELFCQTLQSRQYRVIMWSSKNAGYIVLGTSF